ncbi:MAG: formate/nitrite transporter family protein [Coriobacteriales bacterium]|jgi:formate/nitrite transporter|nr:formate/nitrite transporter family protein [Coriobacteriales bacterium]
MALDQADLTKIQPHLLSGPALLCKAMDTAMSKVTASSSRTFVLAVLAGAFIAMGAAWYCLVSADASLPFAVKKCLGGLVFYLGLFMVIAAGAELFTGNSLMFAAASDKRIHWSAMFKNWGIVWLGNLVGSLVVVALIAGAGVPFTAAGSEGAKTIAVTMVSIAAGKQALVLQPVTLFCKAILCNFLVCLAVWIAFAGKSLVDKFFAALLPIAAFVALGFEHCVANMFFLPMGFVLNDLYGITGGAATAAGAINLGGVLGNIVLVTIGNAIGGAILVAGAYWLAYREREPFDDRPISMR